ncbi:hypothetical protein [Burkholderia cepacia]|uniref:hypothetical protein n=1 Tax=Burkholderia cepacia TaxID=292 RepID=UPI0026501402|nr:hypothetical protein [Burkholderia cepacia]MDN7611049.1 hypothetical protein [Burkholderia cepacia]MDN7633357.1 hypothetical protein [Burkholderia cepacia]
MANPMGAKANYTRSAVNFHNTNNGLAGFGRSGAESFGSPFGSFSIVFRFTAASSHSRNGRQYGPSACCKRATQPKQPRRSKARQRVESAYLP